MLDARRRLRGAVFFLFVPAAMAGCSLGTGDGIVVRKSGGGSPAGGDDGQTDVVYVDDSGGEDMEPSSEWDDGCYGCYGDEPEAEPPPDRAPGDDAAPDEGGDYVDDWDDYADDWF